MVLAIKLITQKKWNKIKTINWSYLLSLETGFSFDLQSAGDSFSDTAETNKRKSFSFISIKPKSNSMSISVLHLTVV